MRPLFGQVRERIGVVVVNEMSVGQSDLRKDLLHPFLVVRIRP